MLVMMQIHPSGTALVPADEQEAAMLERLRECGGTFRVLIRQTRNSKFHRKALALFRFLHELWEPETHTDDGVPVQRHFKAFRKNMMIQAGYFDQVFRGDGSFTLEAKSINFDAMENVEFSEFYGRLVDAGIRMVRGCGGMSPQQVDIAVDRVLSFAS